MTSLTLRFAFVAVVVAGVVLLLRAGFRRDRVLGWVTLAGLALYVMGGLAFGVYLHEVRGRDYFSPDEIGYVQEGERILESWRTGEPRSPIMEGGYPYVNAVVISAWGPSLVPLRIANALVGAFTIIMAYDLSKALFTEANSARLAAMAVAFWPSLVVWSLGNLKERWIALFALIVLLCCVRLISRWSVGLLAGLTGALIILGQLRHYYGAVLGWLCVIGFLIFSTGRSRRFVHSVAVVLAVGVALWTFTGTFMATRMRHEQVRRYVTVGSAASAQPGDAAAEPIADTVAPPFATAPSDIALPPAPAIKTEAGRGTVASARDSTPTALINGRRDSPDRSSGNLMKPGAPVTTRRNTDYSLQGEHVGKAVDVQTTRVAELVNALGYVAFGRFAARGDAGQVLALVLFPEWLLTFLMLPLAVVGVGRALSRGAYGACVCAGFVGALMLVLAWAHGDEWTTYRFRVIYLPILLVFTAGGLAPMLMTALSRTILRSRWPMTNNVAS